MEKKVILSGIQATGDLHLGHYVGVLRNFVNMQNDYDCNYMIANLHALTVRRAPEELKQNTYRILATYLAAGIDPEKSTIFVQSQVPEHAELGWILDCYTYVGELNRMTQYKDKAAKHADNINAGLFTYPSLMAGDILLYNANVVPVGDDQKQHLEITRDIAERFNNLYGETFTIPEPYIQKEGARIMGLQDPTGKMSKSSTLPNDTVFITDSEDEIRKKFKKAVTDSEGIVRYDVANKPGVSNLMEIYSFITNKKLDEVEKEFEGKGYGDFKTAVAEAVITELKPFQEKYNAIINDTEYLDKICKEGAEKAHQKASATLERVYQKLGLFV